MVSPLFRRPLLAALAAAPFVTATAASAQGELVNIEKKFFTMKEFRLESGTVMPDVRIAYETYGTLAPDGRNAVRSSVPIICRAAKARSWSYANVASSM